MSILHIVLVLVVRRYLEKNEIFLILYHIMLSDDTKFATLGVQRKKG